MDNGTIASIVTFEPDVARLIENINTLRGQVNDIFVIDNGSSNVDEITAVLAPYSDVRILTLGSNLGIAAALNYGAEAAISSGAEFVLTMDQDSVAPTDMVSVLRNGMRPEIGVITPVIVDRNKPADTAQAARLTSEVDFYTQPARRGAITSGSLVRLNAWKAAGGYDEEFFIDYVDYDFNQRIFAAGYRIARANRTRLLHEVGRAQATWLWVPRKDMSGRWRIERFYSFGHSPFRCYYKARNRVLFTRKYARELGVTHEGIWQLPQQVLLTVLFERQRLAKLSAFARGTLDGLRWKFRAES